MPIEISVQYDFKISCDECRKEFVAETFKDYDAAFKEVLYWQKDAHKSGWRFWEKENGEIAALCPECIKSGIEERIKNDAD